MYSFEETLQLIGSEIEHIDWDKEPRGLYQPIEYVLSLGGKRIRPVVTLMSCNLYSDNVMQAMNSAIGLEIFHNFTLLHDDIMDRANIRRGKPTVHKKWDDNTAILSGDVMQIEAYKWMTRSPETKLKQVLDLFSKTAAEICEGQQYDMEFEKRDNVSVDEYIEMIRLKTAVLIAAGCQIGAWIGGADDEDAQNLYDFGNNIGLAFQLKDDLLDVYGNEANFGKKIGGDILCNKKTFLLIHALQIAEGSNAEELEYWLKNTNPEESCQKIKAVTELYNRLSVKDICEEAINYYYNKAVASFSNVRIPDVKKSELRKFSEKLMSRND
ncbi:MAG TPA: polyprenyl synthetase family protein [Paludibacteraceae bacterium]|nr:polyprenyl synthetase family protein [Paludibacteraceae bacterium]HPT43017.1 polyprenyl synthetase family protein [Paludibacteraceae bacterium]